MPSALAKNYGLTMLSPVRRENGVLAALGAALRGIPDGAESPWARLPMVHLARFAVIEDLPYVSRGKSGVHPRRAPELLRRPYLMFTADLDGRRDDFLDAVCLEVPDFLERVWGFCEGFPGTEYTVWWRKWAVACEIETTFFFADYPGRSVEEVLRALMARQALVDFHVAHQDADPATLRADYRALMADLRRAPTPARGGPT